MSPMKPRVYGEGGAFPYSGDHGMAHQRISLKFAQTKRIIFVKIRWSSAPNLAQIWRNLQLKSAHFHSPARTNTRSIRSVNQCVAWIA
jgi:hypothetical protein